jgi:cation diffusion facilitator CzcD-associated flavoprotein CzcO
VAEAREAEVADLDAVVVGAGMSGLYALYRLRRLGLRVRGIEAGDNIEGKARVFMPYVGGVAQYRDACAAVVEEGYRGFVLTPSTVDVEAALTPQR